MRCQRCGKDDPSVKLRDLPWAYIQKIKPKLKRPNGLPENRLMKDKDLKVYLCDDCLEGQ